MKNIRFYAAPKYSSPEYEEAENGIYMFHENDYDNEDDLVYVTSLIFEQEPEFGENAPDSPYVSQYPLEDILDDFFVGAGIFMTGKTKRTSRIPMWNLYATVLNVYGIYCRLQASTCICRRPETDSLLNSRK